MPFPFDLSYTRYDQTRKEPAGFCSRQNGFVSVFLQGNLLDIFRAQFVSMKRNSGGVYQMKHAAVSSLGQRHMAAG